MGGLQCRAWREDGPGCQQGVRAHSVFYATVRSPNLTLSIRTGEHFQGRSQVGGGIAQVFLICSEEEHRYRWTRCTFRDHVIGTHLKVGGAEQAQAGETQHSGIKEQTGIQESVARKSSYLVTCLLTQPHLAFDLIHF